MSNGRGPALACGHRNNRRKSNRASEIQYRRLDLKSPEVVEILKWVFQHAHDSTRDMPPVRKALEQGKPIPKRIERTLPDWLKDEIRKRQQS